MGGWLGRKGREREIVGSDRCDTKRWREMTDIPEKSAFRCLLS